MTNSTLKATVAVIALSAGAAFAQTATTDTNTTVQTPLGEAATSDATVAPATGETGTKQALDNAADSAGEALDSAANAAANAAEATANTAAEIADSAADSANSMADETADDVDAATTAGVAADGTAAAPATADTGVSATTTESASTDTSMVSPFAGMVVSDLVGLNVTAAGGEELGEVDYITRQNGDLAAVVGVGGFLGIGQHDVAVPLSEISRAGEDDLTLTNWTKAQVDAAPAVDESSVEKLELEAPLDPAS